MKKVLIVAYLSLAFCNAGFAKPYYFKECKISEKISADYIIDFRKNEIEVNLKTKDGPTQKLIDKIQVITEDQVTSEIIKSGVDKDSYFQYYLNVNSKSVDDEYVEICNNCKKRGKNE